MFRLTHSKRATLVDHLILINYSHVTLVSRFLDKLIWLIKLKRVLIRTGSVKAKRMRIVSIIFSAFETPSPSRGGL